MSFILDALKKSESERQRQAGPALLEMRIIPPSRGLPVWAIVIGAILLVSVGVLGWLALRSHPVPAPAIAHAALPASTSLPNAAAPQSAAPQSVAQAEVSQSAAVPQMPARMAEELPSIDANPQEDNSADNEPAVAPRAGLQAGGADAAKLRKYSEISGTVPELRLDLHVYSVNPAERYAFINMHKVHEGDTTPEGAQVQQITRDGVVLDYNGSEFLLGRQ